jgi:hypothetical protein
MLRYLLTKHVICSIIMIKSRQYNPLLLVIIIQQITPELNEQSYAFTHHYLHNINI